MRWHDHCTEAMQQTQRDGQSGVLFDYKNSEDDVAVTTWASVRDCVNPRNVAVDDTAQSRREHAPLVIPDNDKHEQRAVSKDV